MIGITEAAALWRLADVAELTETHGSVLYRARHADQGAVIVKILKPAGMGELSGMDYLAWRNGQGAVRLLARHDNGCLLEDAGARALEDLRKSDGEDPATEVFAQVLQQLHAASPRSFPQALVPLERHFAALIEEQVAMPAAHADGVAWAAGIARQLLADQTNVMPLHGDLHHENILADDTGRWRAIDPHGLIGDPAYDVANFFGNPLGRPDITCNAARIRLLSGRLAQALDCEEPKVLRFAAAHAALSACWSIGDPVSQEDLDDAGHRLRFLAVVRGMLGV